MGKILKVADLVYGGISETGPFRENNQDSILLPDQSTSRDYLSLAGLADGMGGYAAGEIASSLALNTLHQAIVDAHDTPPEKFLRRGMEMANLEIFKTAQQLGVGRMGTTLTAACFAGETLHLAHIGDSRAYLVRQGQASVLTNDHSIVGEMVRARILKPQAVRAHAQRSTLTHSLGIEVFAHPEFSRQALQVGDQVILCSDGLWGVIEDDEIASTASLDLPPSNLCQALIDIAIRRQSDDNCSVVAIQVQGFKTLIIPEPQPERRKWFW